MISPRTLPLIDMLAARLPLQAHDLGRVALVCHQHLLPSNSTLFRKLVDSGLPPDNIFVLGKPYSTINQSIDEIRKLGVTVQPITYDFAPGYYDAAVTSDCRQLWTAVLQRHANEAFSRIIVLDDGGYLRSNLPRSPELPIIAIEQTASGVRKSPESPAPAIVVAHSAAKRHFESPFIAQALLRKLQTLPCWSDSSRIGMLGLGFLGRYVAKLLKSEHLSVIGYDPSWAGDKVANSAARYKSVSQVVLNSDLLLGCSGTDVIAPDMDLTHSQGRKTLISCSSGDVEFNRLLRHLSNTSTGDTKNPFSDLRGTLNDGRLEIEIINGGFPVNFDRNVEWETTDEIQLTRALLYAALVQALTLEWTPQLSQRKIMLDPHNQKNIVKEWLRLCKGTSSAEDVNFNPHIDWWLTESGGEHFDGQSWRKSGSVRL
jgi:hypothetical protein